MDCGNTPLRKERPLGFREEKDSNLNLPISLLMYKYMKRIIYSTLHTCFRKIKSIKPNSWRKFTSTGFLERKILDRKKMATVPPHGGKRLKRKRNKHHPSTV